jgi:outer membrane receptor protein involved in Fe transport
MLTAVSGYVDHRYQDSRPGDLSDFLEADYGVELPDPKFVDPFHSERLSQEVRLTRSSGATSGSTLGLYYSRDRNTYSTYMSEQGWDQYAANVFGLPATTLGCAPTYLDSIFCGTQLNVDKQIALFGEVDYHIADWTLSAGGRWFHYDQKFDEQYAGFYNGGPTVKTQEFKESGFSPALNVAYKMSDSVLWYASAAKGFRMGGVDDPVANVCDAELAALGLSHYDGVFKSDSLWTYEVGAKKTFGDNRATLDGAAFYTIWNNIQTGELLTCGYGITQNASQERIKGVELSGRVAVIADLSIDLNASYTHSYLAGNAPAIRGVAGDRAPYTPYVGLSGMLNYQHTLTRALQGFALLSVNYRSDSYIDYPRSARLPAQVVGNLRFGAVTGPYRVTLFVDNFTNQLILNDSNVGYGGERNWSVGQPRTAGIELQVDF